MNTGRAKYNYNKHEGIPEIMLRVELLQKRLLEVFKNKEPHILEVGVGTGDVTLMLTRFFKNVVCIEPDPKICRRLLRRLGEDKRHRIKLIRDTAERAELFRKEYDCIILLGMLEHFGDSLKVLKRLSKNLRPGGRMHILVNLSNSIHRLLGVAMGMISKPGELTDSDRLHGHHSLYTPSKLRSHVKSAGLKVVYELPFYLKPLPTSKLNSMPIEIHKGLDLLGQRFPEFASYMYMEAER